LISVSITGIRAVLIQGNKFTLGEVNDGYPRNNGITHCCTECGFESLLEMRQTMEEERIERIEMHRQMDDLMKTVCAIVERSAQHDSHMDDASTLHGDGPQQYNGVRTREEHSRNMEVTVFNGENVFGWTNQVERHFQSKEMNDAEKLQAVMVAMEGKALTWYKWWKFCAQNPTWDDFKSAVIQRFQPSMLHSPFELLLNLQQTGTVEEYREQFELYAGPLKHTEPAYLKVIFLNGLKEGIRAELKLHPLERLSEMMDYAQMIDGKSITVNEGSVGLSSVGKPIRTYNSSCTVTWESGNKSGVSSTNRAACIMGEASSTKISRSFRGKGFRRLTYAENALTIITMVKKKHGHTIYCTSNDEIVPLPRQIGVSIRLQWDLGGTSCSP